MVFALSGKCCSGKSFISKLFTSHGFIEIDVDKLSAEIFDINSDKIIELFGSSVVVDGELSRKAVGDIIFKDSSKRVALQNLIHPLVYSSIIDSITNNLENDYIINIPLLTPSPIINYLDAIIWIKSPLLLRFIRAYKRDSYSILTIFRRIISQKKLSVKHFKSKVDIYYIYNSWFSIGLNKSFNLTLNRLRRGKNDR